MNKVSADQYELNISRAQVKSTSRIRDRVFFLFFFLVDRWSSVESLLDRGLKPSYLVVRAWLSEAGYAKLSGPVNIYR